MVFLGPNGAGKTTTIKALTGNIKPVSGSIRVNGRELPDELQLLKPDFGYVPDVDNHIPEFTGRENLELFAKLYGLDKSEASRVLALLELDKAADLAVKNLFSWHEEKTHDRKRNYA